MFAVMRIAVDGSSFFLSNIFHKTNATKDIQKRRSITSSITPPYITDANKDAIVGFALYDFIIISEYLPKKNTSNKIKAIPPIVVTIIVAISGFLVILFSSFQRLVCLPSQMPAAPNTMPYPAACIAVVMPMVQSAEETGQAAVANSESIFNSINDFTDGN